MTDIVDRLLSATTKHTILYLATPYARFPAGRHAAWELAVDAATQLTAAVGPRVYAPIVNNHPLQQIGAHTGTLLPTNEHRYWLDADRPFMEMAASLVVVQAQSWEDSRGIREEIEVFTAADKPVWFWPWPGPVPPVLVEWVEALADVTIVTPIPEPTFDLIRHLHRQITFSQTTFGPGRRTEGIIDHPGDIHDLELDECRDGITVRLSIASARFHRLKQRRRSMAGRTGCGLCGAESLSQVFRDIAPVASKALVEALALQAAFTDLAANQPMQRLTGATHAAAWAMPDGKLALIREDVGRHNALDKLLGAMASAGLDMGAGAVVVTSRASYEMVQKTAAMGIGILAAISAPTMLAIRMAEALNLTLVGFARHNSHVLYAGADRILPEVSP